jgi:hypothetical protein
MKQSNRTTRTTTTTKQSNMLFLCASLMMTRVGGRPSQFLIYENADNARDRWDVQVSLGDQANASACREACLAKLGPDATTGCTSFTFYHQTHYDHAGECYGDNTGSWHPFYSWLDSPQLWGNVTSGQNDPASFTTPCSDRNDCSYNGVCDGGVCKCYPQWMGRYCGQLHLVETPRTAGLQMSDAAGLVSTWGGSVVRGDAEGTYEMYAAEMTHNTGIVVWLSNSRIRHARSTTGPAGPYVAQDVAFDVWGHEPTAVRAPSGEMVLFWTADFDSTNVPCSRRQCANGSASGDTVLGESPYCLPDTQCTYSTPLRSYMSWAADPTGPWSKPVLVPSPPHFDGDTNLAPIIREDGSLVGLGRPPWVWRATDWRDPSSYNVSQCAGGTIDGEDPFLFVDSRDPSILHGLSHAGGWESSGGHVWSTDGGDTWQRHTDVAAYGSLIRYTDGSHASLSRRERPHLVLGADGVPVALTNGATLQWPCTHPENCPRDHCFTSLQLLNARPS